MGACNGSCCANASAQASPPGEIATLEAAAAEDEDEAESVVEGAEGKEPIIAVAAKKKDSDPSPAVSLANAPTGCPSTSSPAAESPLEAAEPAPAEAGAELDLSKALQEILAHLHRLEADRAWAIVRDLQARSGRGVGTLLASLESLPECNLPLRWMEAWGPIVDDIVETLTTGAIPPPADPRPGEPAQPCEWTIFQMTPAEDDGIQGAIYCRYLPGLHGVEIRSELILPGRFPDHYEGLMETDVGAQVCPACYDKGHQWRSTVPGNFLFSLVIKPPLLPRLWWRDILLHRQVVNFGNGIYAVEYSPKCLRTDGCPRCNAYFRGGEWLLGMPGIKLPKCSVSGRESQFGGYFVEPASLPDGSPGVRWRNVQVAEIHLPKWAPVAKSWYVWAGAFILRRTLREFGRARAGGAFEKGFKQRAAEWPSWYKDEWYKKG